MEKGIFIRDELIAQAAISAEQLAEWEQLKLIKPLGVADDGQPFYSDSTVQRIEQINSLVQVGYDIREVQKIIKKIGLPHSAQVGKQSDSGQYLTVGDLAEKVGVSPRTIKHWEDKGIIDAELRSQGGFRLYPENYVYICKLVQDLQLFGYTLEQIKLIADAYRELLAMQNNSALYARSDTEVKLEAMRNEIDLLDKRISQLREGMQRWEDLLKKKRKEINQLAQQNKKRTVAKADND